MTATDVAAWVGGVSGLAAIVWDFYKWKTSGPRLTVAANSGMKIMPPHSLARTDRSYLTIWVNNTGTTKTTITTISLATYENWCARRRLKNSAAGLIRQPLGHPIPHKLDVGEEWIGSIEQSNEIEEMLRTGKMWCDVYHSWSKRPAQVQVKPKDSAPDS